MRMKQLTMDEIKSVSLDVLQEFHNFCEEKKLRYTLAFGTLIGAVRHKGYIPWDDDIDVLMPRPDYERFFSLYENNDDFAAINHEHGNAMIAFGRLCDMKRTFVDSSIVPWTNCDTGVWIDIFPLDGSEDDLTNLQIRMEKLKSRWLRGLSMRLSLRSFSQCQSISEKIRLFVKKIMFCGRNIDTLLDEHISECRRYDWDTSTHVGHFSHLGNKIKHLWPKEDFEKYMFMEFEGRKFMVCSGYDRHLRLLFGDYMEFPPVEQRIPHHGFNKYYWK